MGIGLLILLAVIQAATEFIPVSSSGHLLIIREWLNVADLLAVDVLLHFATLLSLVWVFREKLLDFVFKFSQNQRLLLTLIVASIPAALFGFFLDDIIETSFRHPMVVAITLTVVGLVMVYENQIFRNREGDVNNASKSVLSNGTENLPRLKYNFVLGGFIVGMFQALALIPGTSRSGISIIGGRTVGMNRRDATEFAFLIGIPVIAGATAKILLIDKALTDSGIATIDLFIAGIVATITGVLVLRFLIEYVANKGLKLFGWYRIVLAILIIGTL